MANVVTGRRSGLVLRGGRERRQTLWFTLPEATLTLAAANSAGRFLVLNAAALALRPFTVVRTRLSFFARSDQTGALETWQVAIGAAVVTDQASAIGVTAVPTPFTDLGSDSWFVHQIVTGVFLFISGVGVHPTGGRIIDVDSKAMRKVEDGSDINFTAENSGISAGTTIVTAGRMLVKLH